MLGFPIVLCNDAGHIYNSFLFRANDETQELGHAPSQRSCAAHCLFASGRVRRQMRSRVARRNSMSRSSGPKLSRSRMPRGASIILPPAKASCLFRLKKLVQAAARLKGKAPLRGLRGK